MEIITILFVLIAVSNAQRVDMGTCPYVSVKQDFEIDRYYGRWYEWGKYVNFIQIQGHCDVTDYYSNDDGTMGITNSQILIINGTETSLAASATYDKASKEAKFSVNIPLTNLPFGLSVPEIPYWILDTDYSSYSVVYSCIDFGFVHFKLVWILTRTKFVFPHTIDAANAVLDANNLDHMMPSFMQTDQVVCPFYW